MHHCVQALADGVESSQAQQIQGCGPHRGQHASPVAAVAVFVLVELGVADPVPAFQLSMLQRSRISRSRASGVVRRLVMNRCRALKGLLPRLPLASSSTIQALPGQSALMCSGASLACIAQLISRPCPTSRCVAMKGMWRFPDVTPFIGPCAMRVGGYAAAA